MEHSGDYDVVVAGGGNAALCAAMVAAEMGARVLVAERAPIDFRAGNSRHTRNVRNVHAAADGFVTGPYDEDEFLADLVSVTGDQIDFGLARLTISESASLAPWMVEHGVSWQRPLRGTLHLSRTNHFFLGGGKSLVNAYYRTAARLGIEIRYETQVTELELAGGHVSSLILRDAAGRETRVGCGAVVVAAGGFQANIDWLREYWGDRAANFAIRGTPYNDGALLRRLLDAGACSVGDPRGAHAIAVDARGPRFDGGIVTRLDTIPMGIVVNRDGRRFYDEGQELWPKRYAIWGTLIADQPDQVAWSIVDAQAMARVMPPLYPPFRAESIDDLAARTELDVQALRETIESYNAAVALECTYDTGHLDDCGTTGLEPPKSHWARPIEPPYFAFPLRPGITFTYLGLKIDARAEGRWEPGREIDNVFAAGEVMAGNILTRGYLAGFGMTIGSTFGRIAGREAAAHALA
jgi:tricarballylate dehydrogenase